VRRDSVREQEQQEFSWTTDGTGPFRQPSSSSRRQSPGIDNTTSFHALNRFSIFTQRCQSSRLFVQSTQVSASAERRLAHAGANIARWL
jgi:hypothetical protein